MGETSKQITIAEVMEGVVVDEVTLNDALRLFKTVYMASRNLAPRTRDEYRNDISQLNDFLAKGGVTKPRQVGLAHLQAFFADLDAKDFSGNSRQRKTWAIKGFFKFLADSGIIPTYPAKTLIPPEREYKQPRWLATEEYQALLRACAHHTRDAAIIELLLQTGIRLSEVARLTVDDVVLPARINRDPANTGEVFVQGKGRKQRSVVLNYKVCRALKSWLAIRPDIGHPALFVTKFRRPMRSRAIQRLVAKHAQEAGIKNVTPHKLRHTFGTHQAIKGSSPRTIQEAMGHSDLRTTSIYVSLAKEKMKRDLQDNAL